MHEDNIASSMSPSRSVCEDTVSYRMQLQLYSYMNKRMNTPATAAWEVCIKRKEKNGRGEGSAGTIPDSEVERARRRQGVPRSCEWAISHAQFIQSPEWGRDTQDRYRGTETGVQETHLSRGGTLLVFPQPHSTCRDRKVGASSCWIKSWKLVTERSRIFITNFSPFIQTEALGRIWMWSLAG